MLWCFTLYESILLIRFTRNTASIPATSIASRKLFLKHAGKPSILKFNFSRAQLVWDSILLSTRARCICTFVSDQTWHSRILPLQTHYRIRGLEWIFLFEAVKLYTCGFYETWWVPILWSRAMFSMTVRHPVILKLLFKKEHARVVASVSTERSIRGFVGEGGISFLLFLNQG